jgi:hypothetical protein
MEWQRLITGQERPDDVVGRIETIEAMTAHLTELEFFECPRQAPLYPNGRCAGLSREAVQKGF